MKEVFQILGMFWLVIALFASLMYTFLGVFVAVACSSYFLFGLWFFNLLFIMPFLVVVFCKIVQEYV